MRKYFFFKKKMKLYTLSRGYKSFEQNWKHNIYDGIYFTINKNIKLCGFGYCGSHEGKSIKMTVNIFENTSTLVYSQEFESPPATSDAPYSKISLKKPCSMTAGVFYVLEVTSEGYVGRHYYGTGSEPKQEHDNGVTFEFKKLPSDSGKRFRTNPKTGVFPELIFYS